MTGNAYTSVPIFFGSYEYFSILRIHNFLFSMSNKELVAACNILCSSILLSLSAAAGKMP